MTETERIARVFFLIAERCAREHGTPLPRFLLAIGDLNKGWGVVLNPMNEKIGDLDPFTAHVSWNGFPAGITNPSGGIIAAGEAANEETLCEWLESDKVLTGGER